MNARRVEDFREFYTQAVPYLQRHEIAHILPLGFLNTWMQVGAPSVSLYMSLVEQDGQPMGIAMRIGGYRAVLSEAVDVSVVEPFAHDMKAAFGESRLPGVMGSPPVVRAFVEVWERVTGCKARLNRAERIYQLMTVSPVRHVSGSMRAARRDDVEMLADWLKAFEIEADPSSSSDTPHEVYVRSINARMETSALISGLRVWEDSGKVVSYAGYAGPTGHGIRIGPVYTPPDQRGRGYASALTAALTQELLDQGKQFVALFTDLSNPTSNHIYQKIGYEPKLDVDEYVFDLV